MRAETCAEIAKEWELGQLILMSGGEAESGGSGKKTILANACEAVLGAIFIEGGYQAARDVVFRFWASELASLDLALPDAKIDPSGMGARTASVAAPLCRDCPRGTGPQAALHRRGADRRRGAERGHGANKRAAEQAAALAMLLREGVWQAPVHD